MMKKMIRLITAAVISVTTMATSAFAATGNGCDEIERYMAEMQARSVIVAQNRAAYNATATPIQKKVDKLIARSEMGDPTAAAELVALMSVTPDWSSNIQLPLPAALPPRAVLVKTGYRYDDEAVATGDTRAFVWVIEDGEICSCNMNSLAWTTASGGFHESVNKILNHQTAGL